MLLSVHPRLRNNNHLSIRTHRAAVYSIMVIAPDTETVLQTQRTRSLPEGGGGGAFTVSSRPGGISILFPLSCPTLQKVAAQKSLEINFILLHHV